MSFTPFCRFAANWNNVSRPSAVLIYDRRNGQFHSIDTDAFFGSHQAGSYESVDGGVLQIHADMMTYDYSPYDSLRIEDFLNNFTKSRIDSKFERFSINTNTWSLTRSEFASGIAVKDFPQINGAFATKPYSFAYFLCNMFLENSSVAKFNVQTGKVEAQLGPTEGYYFHEPVFVPNTGLDATGAEDDGVVMVGGFRADLKGFMMVVDAKTMKVLAEVTAPQLTAPGLHNHFLP